MCFTINIYASRKALEKRFEVDGSILLDYKFQYYTRAFNHALLPVISQEKNDEIKLMEWGLIPPWAKDPDHAQQIRSATYNAKAETIMHKASFKEAVQTRRCLILASGFFEWQHMGKNKIPWYIQMKNEQLFAFAGISEKWIDPTSGINKITCSIITTRANPLMEKIHNTKKRMPVILPKEAESLWIDNKPLDENILSLLQPLNENNLKAHTIKKGIETGIADQNDKNILNKAEWMVNGNLF